MADLWAAPCGPKCPAFQKILQNHNTEHWVALFTGKTTKEPSLKELHLTCRQIVTATEPDMRVAFLQGST